jgi:hypothetical protein
MQDVPDGFPGLYNQRGGLIGDRELGLDGTRRWQCLDFNNVLVVYRSIHGVSNAPHVGRESDI